MAETSEQRIERMLAERTSQRSQRAIDESADQSFRTDQVDRIRSRMERKTATSARHAEDTSDAAREASFSGHIDLPPLAPHDVDSLFDSDTLLASVNAQLDHVASKLGLSHSSKSINALLDYSVGSDLGLTIAKGLGGGSGPNKKDRVDTKSASTLLQEIANTKSPSRTQQASLFPSRMNFNTDPRTAAEDDGGPFDISELWAAASPADSEATQTTVSSADREEDTSYKQGSIAFRVSHEDDATDSVHRIDQLQTRSTKQPPTLFKPAQASSTPSRAAQRIPLSSSSSATVKPNQSILAPKTPMASKNTPKKMQAQRSSSAPRPRSAQKPSTPSQQHTIKPGAKAAKVLPPPPPPVIASKQRAASAGRVRSQATAAASDLMPASHYSLSSFRDVDNDNDTDNHVSSGPYEYVAASPPRTEPRKKEVVRGGARGNTSTTVDSRATRGRRKSEEEGEEGEGEGRVFVNPRSLRMIAASYPRDTEARIEQLAVPKAKILAAKTEKVTVLYPPHPSSIIHVVLPLHFFLITSCQIFTLGIHPPLSPPPRPSLSLPSHALFFLVKAT